MELKQDELETKTREWSDKQRYLETTIRTLEQNKQHEDELSTILKDKARQQEAVKLSNKQNQEYVSSLNEEVRLLKSQLSACQVDLDKWMSTSTRQQQEIKSTQNKLQDMEDDLIVSQSQFDQAEQQRIHCQSQISGLQISFKAQENTLNAMRDINNREVELRVDYQNQLLQSESKIQELSKESDDLKEQLYKVEFNLESLQDKYRYAEEKLQTANEEISNLKQHLDRSRRSSKRDNSDQLAEKYFEKYRVAYNRVKELDFERQNYTREVAHLQQKVVVLKQQVHDAKQHEINDNSFKLQRMINYVTRAKLLRESEYKLDLCFMKRFFLMSIASHQSTTKINIRVLQSIGIYPDYNAIKKRKKSLKSAAFAIIALNRIRSRYEEYVQFKQDKRQLKQSVKRLT